MTDLTKSIQDMLKEETWTRATISNYTQSNLEELAALDSLEAAEQWLKDHPSIDEVATLDAGDECDE